MNSARGAISDARKAARVRRVIEDTLARRGKGEILPDAQVVAAHAELSPDLGRELSLLSMLERARESAGRSRADTRHDGPIQPMGEDAFDGYSVCREVHRGGQGVVYEAVQKSTGRRVAIKLMREGLFAGERDGARFEREVRILGQLEHTGIVGILASGIRAGHFYYVMDYVHGAPLDEYAASIGRNPRRVLAVMDRVCAAVNAAHLRGIIHRDLKPGNILVGHEGDPHVLDFGLARATAEWSASRHMTMTGQFVGSMPWASPEQAVGDQSKVDLRTDVYSLGVILHQALTGEFPYRIEGGPRDVLNNILNTSPARVRSTNAGVDADVEAIVLKCLSKERERRYQSAGELGEDIRRWLSNRAVLARPPSVSYQLRTFARRNRVLVVAIGAVLAALLLGLAGTTLGLIEASAGRRAAEKSRDAARKSETIADQKRRDAEQQAYVAAIGAAAAGIHADDAGTAAAWLARAPTSLRGWEWAHLTAAADRSVAVYNGGVLDARASPDGTRIGAVLNDGSVALLDAADLRTIWRSPAPDVLRTEGETLAGGFSRDGSLFAGAYGSTAVFWSTGTGVEFSRVTIPDTDSGLLHIAFHPDGRRVVLIGRALHAQVWDIRDRTLVGQMPGECWYGGADFSADGRTLAVSCASEVLLVDTDTLAVLRRVVPPRPAHPGDFHVTRFSADGSRLAVVLGSSIGVFAGDDLGVLATLSGHTQRIRDLAFSPDGATIASVSWDRTVRVWNTSTGDQEQRLPGHREQTTGVGFIRAGSRIMSASPDGSIRLWDTRPRPQPLRLEQQDPVVHALCFTPDGRRLISSGATSVRTWDVESGMEGIDRRILTPDSVGASALSPDGRTLGYESSLHSVQFVDVESGAPGPVLRGHTGHISSICVSPSGSRAATTSGDLTLRIWDTATGVPFHTTTGAAKEAHPVRFCPDGSRLATTMFGRTLRVWDAATGAELGSFATPGPAQCVDYSPDGTLLACGDAGGVATIFDAASRNAVHTMTGMKPVVWSVAFNPDGSRLATGSQDRTVRIWDVRTGQELLVLRGHTGSVMTLAWSRDGRRLASAGYDGAILVWDSAPTAPGAP